LGGKSGRKITTSKPATRAVSSAHVSGPMHPPEIMIESWGSDLTNEWTDLAEGNFLDPTTPIFIMKNSTINDSPKSSLYHHRRSFMGCFSCRLRKNIDYRAFLQWKKVPSKEKTKEIANIVTAYITNYYDFITTAPPSKNRDLDNYCCFKLCEEMSDITGIPFIISFQQRRQKFGHGRFESIKAEQPLLIPGWNYSGKSILFVDDFITSGMTAKTCYELLRKFNNHVDGLIYCQY